VTDEENRLKVLMIKCRNTLKQEGIPASENITGPTINCRARSRFGRCRKTAAGYEIEISRSLLECSDRQIETVLYHELLHTCPKCMNHGKLWKYYAARLNEKYGCSITVSTSYEKMGLENPGSRENVKYLVVCSQCGQTYPRKRRCKLVDDVDRYRCGKCGGKLEIH